MKLSRLLMMDGCDIAMELERFQNKKYFTTELCLDSSLSFFVLLVLHNIINIYVGNVVDLGKEFFPLL